MNFYKFRAISGIVMILTLLALLLWLSPDANAEETHEVNDLKVVVTDSSFEYCNGAAACYDRRTQTIYLPCLELDDPVSLYWLGEEVAHHLGMRHD